jgi:hypothetical protein
MSVLYKHDDEINRVAGAYKPYTINPIPDWANAIPVSTLTYTMPADGMLVGAWWEASTSNTGNELKINGIKISQNKANDHQALGTVQVVVHAGDSMVISGASSVSVAMHFVPWKEE